MAGAQTNMIITYMYAHRIATNGGHAFPQVKKRRHTNEQANILHWTILRVGPGITKVTPWLHEAA